MKLIVGLGNPGKEYVNTRHNVGFLALDKIVEKFKAGDFKMDKKFNAETLKIKVGSEDIILIKPQTFMNESGKAVRKIVDFYKLEPKKDLVVIYDDIDIALGKVKIALKGSSAGHRGLQSIIDLLATEDFMRIRIGIGRPDNEKTKIEDWVLQAFKSEEKDILSGIIEDLILNGLQYLGI